MKKPMNTVGGFQVRIKERRQQPKLVISTTAAALEGHETAASVPAQPNYKYRENIILQEITNYINSTYSSHYAQGRVQPGELIMAMGLGQQYFVGNIIKYASRYGKKAGYNRTDLLKAIHYAIMALADSDIRKEEQGTNVDSGR